MMDWEQAYREHHHEVFRFMYYRTSRNKELSSDLTHDVFVRAMRHEAKFADRGAGVAPWLMTIARNLLADHYKSPRRHREELVDAVPDDQVVTSAEGEALERIASSAVMRAVAKLAPEQRDAIVLSYWAGWPDERIAEAMGVRARTVNTRRFRARERLRTRLAEVA